MRDGLSAEPFAAMAAAGADRVLLLRDAASGLRAVIAIDSVALGPACGGIRTQRYPSFDAAVTDAQRLARAMSYKCAIAGLPAGGAKTVVLDHDGLDRPAAFRRLGAYVDDLGGLYRAAGDLGTTPIDLAAMGEATGFVNLGGESLGIAAGIGVVNCLRAVVATRGATSLDGLRIAVQGCGMIGAGVARMAAAEGARLVLADIDPARARSLAAEVGGECADVGDILLADVDVVVPCAVGGVVTADLVERMSAWAICGGANNQLAAAAIGDRLAERGIAYVPDFVASAGAVIAGGEAMFPGVSAAVLLRRLQATAAEILDSGKTLRKSTEAVAIEMARQAIEAGRPLLATAPRR